MLLTTEKRWRARRREARVLGWYAAGVVLAALLLGGIAI
jgi:hypothetical protein